MKKITSTLIVLLLTALVGPTLASAQSLDAQIATANQINSANAMVREGNLEEAIDTYQQIQPANSDREMLGYNLGVAQFRSGDLAEAKEAFIAAAASSDAQLASSSRYNLGNCLYSEALRQAEQNKEAAIQSLHEAIAHYRGALRADSSNASHRADARANIELANELIRKLEDEQQQERQQEEQQQNQQEQNQDQQQQQDQSSDQQDSDQQDSQSQPSEGEQSEDNESESDASENREAQSNSQPSESQDDGEESEGSEESESDNTQQQGDESEDQSDSDSSQETQSEQSEEQSEQQSSDQQRHSNDSQPADRSQADQQHPAGGEPSTDEESDIPQEIPAGELSAAGEQEEQGDVPAAVMGEPHEDDGLMSKEEALKMLQAVRDRDMLRRLRQQQAERSRHVPVDRDW